MSSTRLKQRPMLVTEPPPPETLTESRLDHLIRHHSGTMTDVLITPELANYILDNYNTGNRKLRNVHANSFATTLSRGAWTNTGEAIIFASEGILNNGQHRLEGVVRSGIPALMDLRFGIARAAFAVTDTGARRQAGDILSIHGVPQPFAVAATIKLLRAYELGLPGSYASVNKITNDQIMEGYERWPEVRFAVDLCHRTLKRKGFVNAASNSFTFLALRQAGEDIVTAFLDIIENGLAPSKNDAPRLLRERLLHDVTLAANDRPATVERFALFIKAWNLWRADQRPRVLRWRVDEEFPMINVKL